MRPAAAATVGGWSLVGAAVLFVAVFLFLAARFDYPAVLDGQAASVLPALLALGTAGRGVWALYGLIPLLLIPAALGAYRALGSRSPTLMRAAVLLATVAAGAMMLGLLRWPSVHWELAQAFVAAPGDEARYAIAAAFDGLNTLLGQYVGEFVGELTLNGFFGLTAVALLRHEGYPRWVGVIGTVVAVAGLIAMWRNVTPAVAPVAEIENYLLPGWMLLLGWVLVRGERVPGPASLKRTAVPLLLAATFCATPNALAAQQDSTAHQPPAGVWGALFLGVGSFPAYPGASARQVIPYLGGRVQSGRRYLAIEGITARANILGSKHLELGPAISITFGRSESEVTIPTGTLQPIGLSIEAGGFIATAWEGVGRAGDDLRVGVQVVRGVNNVQSGWLGTARVAYGLPVGQRLRLILSVSAAFADDEYTGTYFSIEGPAVQASGLPAFDASGGALDAGGSLSAVFAATPRWLLAGFAGYRRLVGDAARSPITTQVGSPNQVSFGAGIGYAF